MAAVPNGQDLASIEIDWDAGIRPVLGKWTFDFGAYYYTYPGAFDPGGEFDYVELKTGVSRAFFNDKLALASPITGRQRFSASSARTTSWNSAPAGPLTRSGTSRRSLSGVVGHQWGELSEGGFDYTYWNVGLTLGFNNKPPLSLDLRYWDTGDFNGVTCPSSGVCACGPRVVGSLKASLLNMELPQSTSRLKGAARGALFAKDLLRAKISEHAVLSGDAILGFCIEPNRAARAGNRKTIGWTVTEVLDLLAQHANMACQTILSQGPGRQMGGAMRDASHSVVAVENPDGAGPFVIVCDHASNRIPEDYRSFGFAEDALQTHIAWDPGALAVARLLSARLDAPLFWPDVSRLVIDCNRAPDASSLIVVESEGRPVAGQPCLGRRRALATARPHPCAVSCRDRRMPYAPLGGETDRRR